MRIATKRGRRNASPVQSDGNVTANRIGPNAIIQLAAVLEDRFGRATTEPILRHATGFSFETLPGDMVDERTVRAFVERVLTRFGEENAAPLLRDAGHRTGEYLLAHRIPRVVQWLMRVLPARIGLALLLRAMRANAWTFAGSGHFTFRQRRHDTILTFTACAMCRDLHHTRPVCDFYAGTFEQLIRRLTHPKASVHELECQAAGGTCCRFVVQTVH